MDVKAEIQPVHHGLQQRCCLHWSLFWLWHQVVGQWSCHIGYFIHCLLPLNGCIVTPVSNSPGYRHYLSINTATDFVPAFLIFCQDCCNRPCYGTRSAVFTVRYRHVEKGPDRQSCPPGLYYYERFRTFQKNKQTKDLGKNSNKEGSFGSRKMG